ncbi:MAG: hypothetical protein JEY99_19195 [Spirochaetales bacterium]|nr:hypothetical protein [Spirochaetales bacterium]
MKRSHLLLVSLLILFSCTTGVPPFLEITMEDTYIESDGVTMSYEFSSEAEVQPCRIQIWDLYDSTAPIFNNGDQEVADEGSFFFLLPEGVYQLEFTLLSSRKGELNPLPFLSETKEFRVESGS